MKSDASNIVAKFIESHEVLFERFVNIYIFGSILDKKKNFQRCWYFACLRKVFKQSTGWSDCYTDIIGERTGNVRRPYRVKYRGRERGFIYR